MIFSKCKSGHVTSLLRHLWVISLSQKWTPLKWQPRHIETTLWLWRIILLPFPPCSLPFRELTFLPSVEHTTFFHIAGHLHVSFYVRHSLSFPHLPLPSYFLIYPHIVSHVLFVVINIELCFTAFRPFIVIYLLSYLFRLFNNYILY